MSEKVVKIYTDGASQPNPGQGGYGCVMLYGEHRRELSAGYKLTTNSRMELMAAIAGLEAMKMKDVKVCIYSDSKYVTDSFNKGWLFEWEKKKFAKRINVDLWIRILALYRSFKEVEFIWVKGHSGNPENERCDRLATSMAKNPTLIDEGYKEGEE